MTNQEALIYFKRRKAMCINDRIQEAENIAIECIGKQIPKKPRIEYMRSFKAYCPICEGRLLPSKWCAKCGQAIDWSDNE